jgi:hypothetical protein
VVSALVGDTIVKRRRRGVTGRAFRRAGSRRGGIRGITRKWTAAANLRGAGKAFADDDGGIVFAIVATCYEFAPPPGEHRFALPHELGAGLVISRFDQVLTEVILLASFMPFVSAISGNVELLAAAIVVRGLDSGHIAGDRWRREVARSWRRRW